MGRLHQDHGQVRPHDLAAETDLVMYIMYDGNLK